MSRHEEGKKGEKVVVSPEGDRSASNAKTLATWKNNSKKKKKVSIHWSLLRVFGYITHVLIVLFIDTGREERASIIGEGRHRRGGGRGGGPHRQVDDGRVARVTEGGTKREAGVVR